MKSSKKGMKALEIVAGLIFLIAILVFIFYLTEKIGGQGRTGTQYYSLGPMLEFCREFGKSDEHDYDDNDDDGLPDFCDNCPFVDNDGTDKDEDLYVVGCKGNDGTYPTPQSCGTPEIDTDPNKHPCYKWNGKPPKEE